MLAFHVYCQYIHKDCSSYLLNLSSVPALAAYPEDLRILVTFMISQGIRRGEETEMQKMYTIVKTRSG